MEKPGRIGHRDVSEERADSGETCIAGSCRVTTRRLDVGQEVGDKIGVDIVYRQLRGRLSTP